MASGLSTDTTSAIWSYWYSTSTSNGTNTSDTIWAQWTTGLPTLTYRTDSTGTATTNWAQWIQPVIIKHTAEEIAAQQAAREEANRIYAERREQEAIDQRESEARAEVLLLEFLSEQEKEEYVTEGQFHVLSADGVSKYRIKKGHLNNVEKLDKDGKVEKVFCSHPRITVPDQDNMLAQRFALLHFEEDFEKKMANVRRVG